MKKILLGFLIWGIACGSASAQSAETVQGTWELVSYDYGQGRQNVGPKGRVIKLIIADHYMWAEYATSTGGLSPPAAGHILQTPSWVEHSQFGMKRGTGLAGKDQSLNVVVDGDKMELSGVLSVGLKIAETWKRVH